MGALALGAQAEVFAADRIQWYTTRGGQIDFGRWKGQPLRHFEPFGRLQVVMKENANVDEELRLLEPGDLQAVLGLYAYLHAEESRPDGEEAARVWRQAMASADVLYAGFFVNGRLLSTCNAVVVPNLTRGCRPFAVIENVVTHPEYRRRGYARRCLELLRDSCIDRGCYKLMLLSSLERSGAHALYEAVGFDSQAKQAFVFRSHPRSSG